MADFQNTKYGTISVEKHGSPPKDGERAFLLRAQDQLSLATLKFYRDLCAANGAPAHHIEGVEEEIAQFAAFQEASFTKLPGTHDSPVQVTEVEQPPPATTGEPNDLVIEIGGKRYGVSFKTEGDDVLVEASYGGQTSKPVVIELPEEGPTDDE